VQWQDLSHDSVNSFDLKALYMIRDRLISNLIGESQLRELAHVAEVSLSKLKRLLK
jgi:hypothetical protein